MALFTDTPLIRTLSVALSVSVLMRFDCILFPVFKFHEDHKVSAIGNHLKEQHDIAPDDIAQFFKILKKCQSKFDCLIFEMFFIKELKPTLNKQCDSIRAKLFV